MSQIFIVFDETGVRGYWTKIQDAYLHAKTLIAGEYGDVFLEEVSEDDILSYKYCVGLLTRPLDDRDILEEI